MGNSIKRWKHGSVTLLVLDLIMLFKCSFFKFSEEIISYIEFANKWLSFLWEDESDSTIAIANNLLEGRLTLPQLPKIFRGMESLIASGEEKRNFDYMVTFFEWVLILFVILVIVEIVLHVIDAKFCVGSIYMEMALLACTSYYFYFMHRVLAKNMGFWAIRFTVPALITVILPFVSRYLWKRYCEGVSDEKALHKKRKIIKAKKYCPMCGKEYQGKPGFCKQCGCKFENNK